MTKYYDYVHDPGGRYDGRADASLLLYLGIGYVVINGIVLFFQSGMWFYMTLSLGVLLGFCYVANREWHHPAPKIRRRWRIGIWVADIATVALAILVMCCPHNYSRFDS